MKKLFSGNNILLFIISIVVLIVGYIFLSQGPVDNPLSISVAPFILVGGYCIFVPFSILYKGKQKKENKKK